MKHGLSLPEQAPPSPPPLPLPCLPVCWPGCCCPRTLSLPLPSHFVVGMPASQASKRARGKRRAGRKKRGGRTACCAPPLSSSPAASCLLLACCVLRLSFAFALAAFRRSCFVLAEDAWLARPPFLPFLSLSSQATNIRPPHWTPHCLPLFSYPPPSLRFLTLRRLYCADYFINLPRTSRYVGLEQG